MANPIISDDGHFVWNGTEWIPNEKISEVNIADSVIMGDVHLGASQSEVIATTSIVIENQRLKDELKSNKDQNYSNYLDREMLTSSHRKERQERTRQRRLDRLFSVLPWLIFVGFLVWWFN